MIALTLCLHLCSPAQAQAPEGPSAPLVLDRVLVVVGDRIVTGSDLRLELELARRDPCPVPALEARRRADPLELLVDAAVVRNLAGNIAIYAPSPTEVQQRLARLRASWVDPDDWARFLLFNGLDEDRLAGRLYSRMVVERFVYRNVGIASEAAEESDAEALERYLAWIQAARDPVEIRAVDPRQDP